MIFITHRSKQSRKITLNQHDVHNVARDDKIDELRYAEIVK